ILFGHLPATHSFRSSFFQTTGTEIELFIDLSVAMLQKFVSRDEVFITHDWFQPLDAAYSPKAITRFLSALSLTFDQARTYLSGREINRLSISYEFYEQSPLKRYPLLFQSGRYYSY